jgi:two-component sensor histidine kinase
MTQNDEISLRLRQQTLLSEFGLRALREDNLVALLQLATEMCAAGMNAKYCKALEYNAVMGQLLVIAGTGWGEGIVGQAVIGADMASPAGFALRTGQPVISNHLSDETRFETPEVMAAHGVRRAINVIISNREGDYGVLEVDDTNEGAFGPADVAFMQGFANLLGGAIERQRVEARLRAALERQELLAREMSHRVKNGLTVVRSMLALQSKAVPDENVRRALLDAQSRIDAVAQVHDQLWRQPELGIVDLKEFVTPLCANLEGALGGHRLKIDVPNLRLDADRAIPLGLLLTELVTNAGKYAYPAAMGDIRVSVRPEGDGFVLSVADDGVGLPAAFDLEAESRTSLGMRIIKSLAMQLSAKIDMSRGGPGATFSIYVPAIV